MTRAPSEATRSVIPIRPSSNDIASESTMNIEKVENENTNKIMGTAEAMGPDWNWQPEADATEEDKNSVDERLQGEEAEVLRGEEKDQEE